MAPRKKRFSIRRWIWLGIGLLLISIVGILKLDYRLVFELGRDIPKLERPVSEDALVIIRENSTVIKQTAKNYGLSPVAIAGIILTEMSLDPGPVDRWEEWRIRDKYLEKPVNELEDLLTETRGDIAERIGNGENEHEFLFKLNRPLTWSIGVCQITSLRAIKIEESMARANGVQPRNIQEVIEQLLIPASNIEYCGQELSDIRDLYRQHANIDISQKPEILGTLFNTGKAKEKAMAYLDNPNKTPLPNEFGEYITLHRDLISDTLK